MDWLEKQQDNESRRHVTFLEPSCGNGQVVWTLLETLKNHSRIKSYSIIACDIDRNAIAHCQSQDVNHEVEWMQGDFLSTQRRDVVLEHGEGSFFVVLGGPPYTMGAGTGNEMQRDLPEHFVSHCLAEYEAHFVAFLLPRRYETYNWPWPCQARKLASSTFCFHGKPVTQPSILQCFTRKTTG